MGGVCPSAVTASGDRAARLDEPACAAGAAASKSASVTLATTDLQHVIRGILKTTRPPDNGVTPPDLSAQDPEARAGNTNSDDIDRLLLPVAPSERRRLRRSREPVGQRRVRDSCLNAPGAAVERAGAVDLAFG